jgi:tRNA threonylcarbamoyl adenosine modification protein (Sua5/YciO/YrdC/YwlC family)
VGLGRHADRAARLAELLHPVRRGRQEAAPQVTHAQAGDGELNGGLYTRRMARYFDIHPANPQRRAIVQVADIVREGGVIAYPTDSCYALGCQLGNKEGIERIRAIRRLDERHHLTLVCQDFAQLGQFVHVPNRVFRAIKAATPGSYTFILAATKEVPRRLQHPGKKTIGVRIPDHLVTQALLAELGEPLVSTTLLLPGAGDPLTQGWAINEQLGDAVDAVIDSGDCGTEPTTVIDFSSGEPEIVRRGAGDPSDFE